MLLLSFSKYIESTESSAVTNYLSQENVSLLQEVIVPMLSRFNCSTNPNPANFKQIVTKAAHFALVCQPYYASAEMKRGMLLSFPQLWGKCDQAVVGELCDALLPTQQKVWSMVGEPVFNRRSESRVFDYF